jgi:hypothetical protein
MIEEIAGWLIIGDIVNLDVSVYKIEGHFKERLHVLELLEVFRAVERVVTHTQVAIVVEPA